LAGLQDSKKRGLARVLASLGIHHIGVQTARVVASHVNDIDELLAADLQTARGTVTENSNEQKLEQIRKAATAFHEKLHSAKERQQIEELQTPAGMRDLSGNHVELFLNQIPLGRTWGLSESRRELLINHFHSLNQLEEASAEEFVEVFHDEVVGRSLYDFLHSQRGRDAIDGLRKVGVDMTSDKGLKSSASLPLAGKTLVVTGTLEKYGREEIEELIVQLGGHAASSVSKSTDYLVAGEKAGSKLDKAKKLGVPVIGEAEFEKLIGRAK
jgi:NAD-dependent DNA ligase